jgi:membrane protease YdiL (CAAX protease family)
MTVDATVEQTPVDGEQKPRFLIRDVLFVVLFGFGVGLSGAFAVGLLMGIVGIDGDDLIDSVSFAFLFQVLIYVGAAYAVKLLVVERRGISWRQLGFTPPKDKFILQTLGVWVVMIIAAGVIATIMDALINEAPGVGDQLALGENLDLSPLDIVMIVLGTVIAPSIVEEVVFRSLLFCSIRQRWSFLPTAIVSSLVFAAVHQPWVVIPTILVLGFSLAWLRERFGSLYPPILLHALNNSLAITLFLVIAT